MNNKDLKIWLGYVSYPVTTAVYFERALRQNNKVVTVGPTLPESFIKSWQLENMKLPITPLDIETNATPDIHDLIINSPKDIQPDIFLWIESVNGYYPQNLSRLSIPKACYFIDSHLNLQRHLEWAKNFDYVFIAQLEYLPAFKNAGIANVFWLPLGCDPEIHSKKTGQKIYDVGFVGSLGSAEERRYKLLKKIEGQFQLVYKRCFWDEMSEHFSQSKIVFNNAIRNDLNMRLFEVLSTGSFLLSDLALNSGQAEMFRDGEELGIYSDEDILDKIGFYLKNEGIREKIAIRGQQVVHSAHTYRHRVEELLNVSLFGQRSTPDPVEWRDRSVKKISINNPTNMINNNNSQRSFVIPVLDMSPASPFNIVKLLDDLANIEGDVIIIFNSLSMAEQLKNHPRIDYYAVMNENVGVSRAWNIGLNMSQTPITFILNSDLHIEKEAVEQLEKALFELEDAAIVGPQGSYFSYELGQDLQYFDKGSFNYPINVDAVSGFFFAVKTELFNRSVIKFDNQYTPCYFEEWDLGLQIKLVNLKSYIVPVTGYEHEWSGSIRALRKIRYLKKEETAGEILERNRKLFRKKWDQLKSEIPHKENIFISLWVDFICQKAERLIQFNMTTEAIKYYKKALDIYPENTKLLSTLGMIEYKNNNLNEALTYFSKVQELDPEFQISALDNDSIDNSSDHNLFKEEPTGNIKTEDYYENPRPDIQKLVNPASKKILDIGCGKGLMASELKQTLSAEVWGIEIVHSAFISAQKKLDKVLCGGVEENIKYLPDSYFDTIIFADVLEHLIDPYKVLAQIRSKLSGTGEIIASIPNVRFWNVLKNLLSGFWEYEDSGIMDNSHLRFFTRNSIQNMLINAGYKIKDFYSLRIERQDLSQELLNALSSAGISVQTLNDESKDFQYIVRATK